MKVVFDTNVYIAEAMGGETARSILTSAQRASWRIYISQYIIDELRAVMIDELGLARRSAALAVLRALRRGNFVQLATSRHVVPKDPADSAILQTALQAGADFLVTNDRHLLDLHPYQSLQVMTMARFRSLLESRGLFELS